MKNTDAKEIVFQLGVARALFSVSKSRAKKAGAALGIFPWRGIPAITGNMGNIATTALMMSAKGTRN